MFSGPSFFPSSRTSSSWAGLTALRFPDDVEILDGRRLVQPANDLRRRRVVQGVRVLAGLTADRDQGIAEGVERLLRLSLGRLDHQALGDDEGEVVGGGMEAVVDESLRDVQSA